MAGNLARRTPSALADLLRRRPDVLAGAPPRDLTDLGLRLVHPQSVVLILQARPVPFLEVTEAALALGASVTRSALAGLLAGSGTGHRTQVDAIVDELVDLAVFISGDGDRLIVPEGLNEIFPSPLGLGPPLRPFLLGSTFDTLRRIAGRLGLERPANKAEAVDTLGQHLGDADFVRGVVASAPPEIRDLLGELAGPRRSQPDDDLLDDYELDDFYAREPSGRFDPTWYARDRLVTQWAGDHGLMFSDHYTFGWRMPAEIGRALRGAGYQAPFTPVEPRVPARPVATSAVETEAGAAVSAFADLVLALLDHVVRSPIPALKSGGVGARELTRLAKLLGCDEAAVRLALELADRAGLLDDPFGSVRVSDAFDAWRAAEPADRLVGLLDAWWSLGSTPSRSTDVDGKTLRALTRPVDCEGCRAARVGLVAAVGETDGAVELEALALRALWRRPLVHLVEDDEVPFASVWREARLLGVVGLGALSELGRALLSADSDRLRSVAVALLPPSSDAATFGADLTVYVAGTPSGRVTAVLDRAADREGHGGAVTWRFGPASIRRALDSGATGDALLEELAAIATADLPQPLRFLIGDVARRHGNLRLTSVVCCVRSDDEALLAELASDRKLAKLGLRLLAPTVLASDTSHDALLAALRKAGYFPVSDDARAEVIALRPVRRAPERRAVSPAPVDVDELAARLLRHGVAGDGGSAPIGRTERVLGGLAASLSLPEVRQLAHAIDTGSRVTIAYESATGALTHRVIGRAELSAGSVYAWCELRRDERVFTVSRIRSVSAV